MWKTIGDGNRGEKCISQSVAEQTIQTLQGTESSASTAKGCKGENDMEEERWGRITRGVDEGTANPWREGQ